MLPRRLQERAVPGMGCRCSSSCDCSGSGLVSEARARAADDPVRDQSTRGRKNYDAPYAISLSPDGRHLAFVGIDKDGKQMLWLRSIDSGSAVALAGTENGEIPFWSPDSRWVGFSANGKLQKTDIVAGSQPQAICDIKGRAGGTWNRTA